MKKHFIIFERDFQDTTSTIGLVKYHKLGVNNKFNTQQAAENFIFENPNLFNIDIEYVILPVYEKN